MNRKIILKQDWNLDCNSFHYEKRKMIHSTLKVMTHALYAFRWIKFKCKDTTIIRQSYLLDESTLMHYKNIIKIRILKIPWVYCTLNRVNNFVSQLLPVSRGWILTLLPWCTRNGLMRPWPSNAMCPCFTCNMWYWEHPDRPCRLCQYAWSIK